MLSPQPDCSLIVYQCTRTHSPRPPGTSSTFADPRFLSQVTSYDVPSIVKVAIPPGAEQPAGVGGVPVGRAAHERGGHPRAPPLRHRVRHRDRRPPRLPQAPRGPLRGRPGPARTVSILTLIEPKGAYMVSINQPPAGPTEFAQKYTLFLPILRLGMQTIVDFVAPKMLYRTLVTTTVACASRG